MARVIIKLPSGEWSFDDANPLGPAGGFGEVFRGAGELGEVAIKRLKLSAKQSAYRELHIGEQLMKRNLNHVVPIFDAGQDAQSDRYFLVMPICDLSLQDKISRSIVGIDALEIGEIVRAIIAGLKEVRDITHRDLKPANILLHEGNWKIADFGIAKFVEDSTSAETLRDSLTPLYAAPEQWRGQRATSATDIYALGCVIHALCNGHPPFTGSMDEIRDQHLTGIPPLLTRLPKRQANFVSHMLRKIPTSRPTLERCSEVFEKTELEEKKSSPAQQRLSEAASLVAAAEAQKDAEILIEMQRRQERDALFVEATNEFIAIRSRLFKEILDSSDSAAVDAGILKFGRATLRMHELPRRTKDMYRYHSAVERSGWDVLCWSMVSVQVDTWYTWSASLLFADKNDGNGYRWYEVAFWSLRADAKHPPYWLEGHAIDLHLALGPVMHSVNVAYGPYAIDGEDQDGFISRWIGLVAKAAVGKLTYPKTLPITTFDY